MLGWQAAGTGWTRIHRVALSACLGLSLVHSGSAQGQPERPAATPTPAGQPTPPAALPKAAELAPAAATPRAGASAPPTDAPAGSAGSAGARLSLLQVVQSALRQHSSIQLAAARVAERDAAIRAAEGPFDTLFLASAGHVREHTPVLESQALVTGHDSTISDTTALGLGLDWAARWGTRVSPSIGLQRVHLRPGGSVTVPGLASDPFHQAQVDLSLTQPLLRGAGRTAAASGIDAARLSREAAQYAAAHTAQQQALTAILAYWSWVGTSEFVQLLAATEAGARKLRDDTKILVDSDARPRSDLNLLEGNVANRSRQVIDAQADQLRALFALYDAMGQSAEQAPSAAPAQGLPEPVALESGPVLVQNARNSRQDLKALRQEVGAVATLLQGAEANTDPALDLNVGVGYRGAVDRVGPDAFFTSLAENVPGISGSVSLSLELPVANTAREAERDLRIAQREQSRIALLDLERRLPIDVLSAVGDLELSAESLQAASRAVQQYERALADEQDRLRAGVGTVIDIVLTQDQLISAQLARTNARLRYAVALTRLQFEIGALPSDASRAAASLARLVHSPSTGAN